MPFVSRMVLRDAALAVSLESLFFRTGFDRESRTSNVSNRIEATGFALKKAGPLAARTIVDLSLHP